MSKITAYFNRVDKLAGLYLPPEKLPVVALTGPYNSGKSTMINSLLEQDVSPVDILPATSVPIIFSGGEMFLITARLTDGRKKVLGSGELRSLPRSKDALARRILEVEIILNHPLLRRIRLIDTPGFDAASGASALPPQLAGVDHIVYLLHQRGPGEADRKFIKGLLELKEAEQLSFWINRNLGRFDGTSLTESRRVLREVCARETRVYVTDTKNPEAVRRFCQFIRARAAETVVERVAAKLKEQDRRIPELAAASLRENKETSFLLRFWDAVQSAEEVIQGGTMINTLPLVARQINDSADDFIRPEEGQPESSAAGPTPEKAPDPAVVRGRIKSLLQRAAGDPALQSAVETRTLLRTLARKLDGDRFLVTAAGGFSTGKTTFFNALLGENLLPAKNRPTTFTITRLRHGDRKRAVIRFADRVAIPTHFVEKKQAAICRLELEVLESWLTDNELRSGIRTLEKVRKGRRVVISPDELLLELEMLKETFARVKQSSKKRVKPWKSLFKHIPLAIFRRGGQADSYVVHFNRRDSIELDLTGETGLRMLEQTVGSHRALRVEEIEISHPTGILRTADFLDTPGLDSVYHRHREITNRHLSDSDCFLFFLNGKHILTKPDLGAFNIISEVLNGTQGNSGKLFIIVNFADALNEREKERVLNYLHITLAGFPRGTPAPAGIYLLSALDALTGRDGRALSSLTADLRERIWSSRCAGSYGDIIRQAKSSLTGLPGPSPVGAAVRYVRELENLEREIITPGGRANGKRQGAG